MSSEPEKKESSVLFSLRELQQIEEDRISEEEESARLAEEDRIRGKMEAERLSREEEEARLRGEAEADRMSLEAKEKAERDGQLRLQEAETRARIEASGKLEAERLQHEMEARKIEASKKRPVGLIATAVVLVFVVSGLGIWAYGEYQEGKKSKADALAQQIASDAEKERLEDELAKQKALMEEITKEIESAQAEFDQATSDADREAAQRRLNALRDKRKKAGKKGGRKRDPKKPDKTVRLTKECIMNPLHSSCPK
jgi:colicin import membrane protein